MSSVSSRASAAISILFSTNSSSLFDVGHVDADGAASGEWFVLPATTALRASRRRRQKLSGQSRLDRQNRRLRFGEGRVHARVLQSE